MFAKLFPFLKTHFITRVCFIFFYTSSCSSSSFSSSSSSFFSDYNLHPSHRIRRLRPFRPKRFPSPKSRTREIFCFSPPSYEFFKGSRARIRACVYVCIDPYTPKAITMNNGGGRCYSENVRRANFARTRGVQVEGFTRRIINVMSHGSLRTDGEERDLILSVSPSLCLSQFIASTAACNRCVSKACAQVVEGNGVCVCLFLVR